MMITHGNLHHTILSYIIEKGYAPEISDLATIMNQPKENILTGLYNLETYHGIVLHPNQPKIWVIHPFSLAPTNFLVKSSKGKWWGNCAWCSLGIAAILKDDVVITTSSGAHGDPLTIEIINGELQQKDLLVHFPIPMKKAWDNVIYTCSTMLLFRFEEEIDQWCQRHNIPKGDVQLIDHIWKFAKVWYGNHLKPDWKKWTNQEAKRIFAEFNLSHEIWALESSEERF